VGWFGGRKQSKGEVDEGKNFVSGESAFRVEGKRIIQLGRRRGAGKRRRRRGIDSSGLKELAFQTWS